MNRIAVLIPCYNEALTVEKVISDFKRVLPEADVYVYDNNSSDNTYEIAEKAGAITRRERSQGKGNVVRRMFREIEADCYIMVDGDDTYDAESAPEMARLVLEEQADMVIGDRLSSSYFTENKRPFHNFGNKLVRRSINTIFKNDVKDIMTGLRAMSRLFVKTYPVLSRGFELETEMTIHTLDKNMRIVNVISEYRDRPEGSFSKLNTVRDGTRVIKTIIALFKNYKPFAFFTLISVLLFLAAVVLFIPILIEYLTSDPRQVSRFPTLFVCGAVSVAAIVFFVSGMILDVIMKNNRRDFEMRLVQTHELHKKETDKQI
jgi:glycosyltransferase involved in cell wall biosynthesis